MKKIIISFLIVFLSLYIIGCQNNTEKEANEKFQTEFNRLADLQIQKNLEEENKKPFTFRGIILGAPLDRQLPECQGDWYKKTEPCYRNIDGQFNHYTIEALPDIGFGMLTIVNLIDGNIESISTSTGDRDAQIMIDLLQKKYGKPVIYNTEITQNRMGAKFSRVMVKWKIKNCEILLMTRVSRIDDGLLIITTKKWRDHEAINQKNKEQRALDKL